MKMKLIKHPNENIRELTFTENLYPERRIFFGYLSIKNEVPESLLILAGDLENIGLLRHAPTFSNHSITFEIVDGFESDEEEWEKIVRAGKTALFTQLKIGDIDVDFSVEDRRLSANEKAEMRHIDRDL